jgi:serine/threonine protein kinase
LGLVGYCYEHGEQMLVYEFMVNGTVSEWLAGKMAYPLDWTKRLSIAVGSARGLTYLHELADPPIIHRDIKSQNILLDEKHIAKVADFGLSKLAPDGADKQIATDQVKGTLGYLDPEYYMTQHLSEKSDVYSFGVVLLELATSKPPIQGGKYVVREVRTALNEGGMDALEPLLDPSVYEASQEDLDRYIDLSLSCVADKGEDRPTMNEVVKELETLAQHNKPKAKASAQATDPTWLTDVYGDEDYVSADHGSSSDHGPSSNFKYSGGYSPHGPQAK